MASVKAINGSYVVGLEPGVERRAFIRSALDRYEIHSFSQKEPDLEEIYLEAVRNAGMEETRTVE